MARFEFLGRFGSVGSGVEVVTGACSRRAGFVSAPNCLLWPLTLAAFLAAEPLALGAAPGSTDTNNRPIRARETLVLTVGQSEGQLQGSDDKVIQAGIEYLSRLGGGTLRLLPGTYTLQNSIFLRPNLTLEGAGDRTILAKADSVVTPLARDADWFEYGVQVKDPAGFVPGGGIMLRVKTGEGDWSADVLRATITGIHGNRILIDQTTQKNFWTDKDASAMSVFPLLTAEHVDEVVVKDLVLDGRRDHNEHINGNFSGAVFIEHCNRWHFLNVIARDYNGDGFSFQVCDDIRFDNCQALHNGDLGFHAGSGSQRPIFRECIANNNNLGLFFCWSVSEGLAENCKFSENKAFGISFGHRDTDNIIRKCTLERNGAVGILFRDEETEFRSGHRNKIEDCVIRDTGSDKPGVGIDIQGKTQDILVKNVSLESTPAGKQKTGIRIGKKTQGIVLQDNTFNGCHTPVEDLR